MSIFALRVFGSSTCFHTRRRVIGVLVLAVALAISAAGAGITLTIGEAPPSLSAAAERVRRVDMTPLAGTLARAGLDPPPRVQVTLIPEDDPRARATPTWIVGRAVAPHDVVIFPARAASYPYDSLEAVVHHELVHLALFARSGGRSLPRWFHEGVAVSVAAGWDIGSRLRLVAAMMEQPAIAEVTRLFESDGEPDTAQAYLLAAALVHDLRTRHGPALPGAIARRVADGGSFEAAFEHETGETVAVATRRAWGAYLRWTSWIPFVTDPSAVWTAILVLACIAFLVQVNRRLRRRRQWDEEEE